MKTGEDFRREFPEAEEGFRDAEYQELLNLREQRRRSPMRLKPVIAFALILALLASVGVAATVERWSLFSSVPEEWQTASEEEVSRMKDSFTPVHMKGNSLDATVLEAIYDGYGLYLVVDMRPSSAGVFLLPRENADLSSPAGDVVKSFPHDVTLAEHIKALGYSTIYRVDMSAMLSNSMIFPATVELNEDGSFSFFLRVRILNDQYMMLSELKTELSLVVQRNANWNTEYVSTEMSVPAQPVLEAKISAEDESHVFANCGVRISNVQLYRTLLTTYLMADVEIVDQQVYDDHYTKYLFFAADKDGNRLNSGYFNVSGVTENRTTGGYVYTCTLSMKELPDSLCFVESTWRIGTEKEIVDQWVFLLEDMN